MNYNNYQNMLATFTFYNLDTSTNELNQGQRLTFHYSGQILDKAIEQATPLIRVYPNPANDYIYISNIMESVQFELFNINGEKVREHKLTKNTQIQVNHLK